MEPSSWPVPVSAWSFVPAILPWLALADFSPPVRRRSTDLRRWLKLVPETGMVASTRHSTLHPSRPRLLVALPSLQRFIDTFNDFVYNHPIARARAGSHSMFRIFLYICIYFFSLLLFHLNFRILSILKVSYFLSWLYYYYTTLYYLHFNETLYIYTLFKKGFLSRSYRWWL